MTTLRNPVLQLSMMSDNYTCVSVVTLQNVLPAMTRYDAWRELEDRIDNEDAEIALREALQKGTRSWDDIKAELRL